MCYISSKEDKLTSGLGDVSTEPGWMEMLIIPLAAYSRDWHLVSMFKAACMGENKGRKY